MEHLIQTQLLTSILNSTDTPNGHNEQISTCQKQKKPCCAVNKDTTAKEKMDLGMFYLCNTSINPSDVFLKDMPIDIFANFICKSKECNNMNCNFYPSQVAF